MSAEAEAKRNVGGAVGLGAHRPLEFAIWEARISAFAMRKDNDMRLPWYFDMLSNHTTALQPSGGIVGLSHRGSRRINGKFVGNAIVGDAINHRRRDESRLYKGGW